MTKSQIRAHKQGNQRRKIAILKAAKGEGVMMVCRVIQNGKYS